MESSPAPQGPLTHRLGNFAEPPQPVGGFATTTVVFLSLIAVTTLFGLFANIAYLSALSDFAAGDASSGDVVDASLGSTLVGIFNFIFFCLAAGFFIAWMFRGYTNLRRSSVVGLRYEPGWAIGAWFIPFFNLVRPKQMLNEVWRAGAAGVEVRDESWRAHPLPMLMQWWWGLWVASFLVSVAAGILAVNPDLSGTVTIDDVDRLQSAGTVGLVAGVASLVAAILGALVVRRITSRLDPLTEAVMTAAQAEYTAYYGEQAPAPLPVAPAQPAPPPAPQGEPGSPPPPPLPQATEPPPPAPIAAGEDGKIRCEVCGWVFTDEASARKHAETHHRSES